MYVCMYVYIYRERERRRRDPSRRGDIKRVSGGGYAAASNGSRSAGSLSTHVWVCGGCPVRVSGAGGSETDFTGRRRKERKERREKREIGGGGCFIVARVCGGGVRRIYIYIYSKNECWKLVFP